MMTDPTKTSSDDIDDTLIGWHRLIMKAKAYQRQKQKSKKNTRQAGTGRVLISNSFNGRNDNR